METVETLWLLIATWFLGMFLPFLILRFACQIWRIAIHGYADGVRLRRSWRLNILYSQYWLLALAASLVWLVFAGISMTIADQTSATSLQPLARLVAYIMGVFAIAALVFSTLGVRYIRHVILRDTAKSE